MRSGKRRYGVVGRAPQRLGRLAKACKRFVLEKRTGIPIYVFRVAAWRASHAFPTFPTFDAVDFLDRRFTCQVIYADHLSDDAVPIYRERCDPEIGIIIEM